MEYTLLLKNGRIIDPVNRIDTIGDIGVKDGKIVEVARDLDVTKADKYVDVSDKWVIPGVIDPHMHVSSWIGDYPGLSMMAEEGVITALDMAGPPVDVISNILNHGSGMNIACVDAFYPEKNERDNTYLADNEIQKRINDSVVNGAIGIKILGGHYPLSPELTRRVIRLASEQGVYVAFHAGTTKHGSHINGLKEAVELADGYPLHLAHINSYCRGAIDSPLTELGEAVELLKKSPNIWSESYLSVFNGTSAKCFKGEILSQVTKRCCRIGGFNDTEEWLGEAIRAGFGNVVRLQGGGNVLVSGDEGYSHWIKQKTDVTISFPVNLPYIQVALATMKDDDGNFIVDSLSTDGGGIPRNTMVQQGLDLVQFGALSAMDFVKKVSSNAAEMMGLSKKGHLSPGADGDITVLDPVKGRAYMGIALGKIIMIDNIVIGNKGTLISTKRGEGALKKTGIAYELTDISKALPEKNSN